MSRNRVLYGLLSEVLWWLRYNDTNMVPGQLFPNRTEIFSGDPLRIRSSIRKDNKKLLPLGTQHLENFLLWGESTPYVCPGEENPPPCILGRSSHLLKVQSFLELDVTVLAMSITKFKYCNYFIALFNFWKISSLKKAQFFISPMCKCTHHFSWDPQPSGKSCRSYRSINILCQI